MQSCTAKLKEITLEMGTVKTTYLRMRRQWNQETRVTKLCHEELLNKTAPAVISGFPISLHNFPTALGPQDRNYDYHLFIDDVNTTIQKLNGMRVNLHNDGPKHLPKLTTLSNTKLLIQNESVPKLLRELWSLALMPSNNPSKTLYSHIAETLS